MDQQPFKEKNNFEKKIEMKTLMQKKCTYRHLSFLKKKDIKFISNLINNFFLF